MLALSPTATEFPIIAAKLGVIVQVRLPTVIELEETAATTPVAWDEGAPVLVALVVTVVVPPFDEVDEDEDDEDDCVDETDELDETLDDDEMETEPGLPAAPDEELPDVPDAELAAGMCACLIVLSTPRRHRIAANCPEEKPDTEACCPTRQAR
jgi:hypothetical protein